MKRLIEALVAMAQLTGVPSRCSGPHLFYARRIGDAIDGRDSCADAARAILDAPVDRSGACEGAVRRRDGGPALDGHGRANVR